jgi:plasmid stabilization system protein ParE
MSFRVERSIETDADLEAIFDFLFQAYLDFGDSPDEALERAVARIEQIEAAMLSLGAAPHQGTLRPDLLPGLRAVTKQRAVFYFDVDEGEQLVRVLAVFFGGPDLQRAMLRRLAGSVGAK